VILADTSAWVAFLRGSGSPACVRLRSAIGSDEVSTTDIVQLELLAGARDARHHRQLKALLGGTDHLAIAPGLDAEHAADLFQACRRYGETPRQVTDCLIAAVAIRNDIPVLHEDRDFEAIARHTSLRTLIA